MPGTRPGMTSIALGPYSIGCILSQTLSRSPGIVRHHLLLGCQPAIHLGGNAQSPGFSQRGASLFARRHLAGLREYLRRPVIPNPAVRWLLGLLFHDQLLYRGVDELPNASVSTIIS